MNRNSDNTSLSIERLLEVAEGGQRAYEEAPTSAPDQQGWDEVVRVLAEHPHPEPPAPTKKKSQGAANNPAPEEWSDFWKDLQTYPREAEAPSGPEKSELETPEREYCGTFLNEPLTSEVPNPQLALCRIPRPITPDYLYVGPVENAGELYSLYNSFKDVLSGRPPVSVLLDSGEYEFQTVGHEFILEDQVKGFRYQSEQSAKLTPAKGDVFIWVLQINGNFYDKIGYLVNEFVFVRR